MTALDDGEKAAVTVVYKRRWEVQQRWRTWRDGDAIIDPLNAESEGRGRIQPTKFFLFIYFLKKNYIHHTTRSNFSQPS
jgi:hypothetical protein